MAHRHVFRSVTWLSTAMLLLAIAAPVSAVKPVRGCSDDKEPMTMDEFRDLSVENGVPPELLFNADWEAGWAAIDKNGDTIGCVQDLPDNAGHLGTWVYNIVDNTANS